MMPRRPRSSGRVTWIDGAVLAVGLIAAGCATSTPTLAPLPTPLAADSIRTDTIAPGLIHHGYWSARGPWSVQVLEADRAACWTPVAVKAGGAAVGREPTSALLRSLERTATGLVGGGVNADFFSFDPPGIPTGAHVSAGRVISGPSARPVFAVAPDGAPWIGVLATEGFVRIGGTARPLAAWNQRRGAGIRLFDPAWGPLTDSAAATVEVQVGGTPRRVLAVDTTRPGIGIPLDGLVLVADSTAPALRDRLRSVRAGEPVDYLVRLTPFSPREAVGGFPVLVVDSAIVPGLDSAGGRNFGPVRHPRTAVGLAQGGRRILLVTVDGRQPPFSDGMTLVELAHLFRSLGATAAINLDGGGSTAMVVRRGGGLDVVNRPSDRTGERPVANALALVRRCATRP